MQEYLHNNFQKEGHNDFLEHLSVTLTDKNDGFDLTKRETFWMHTPKTLAPYGLKVENGFLNSAWMLGGRSFIS